MQRGSRAKGEKGQPKCAVGALTEEFSRPKTPPLLPELATSPKLQVPAHSLT